MWQIKQLERLYEVEPEAVDTAIKELLEKEPVLREKLIIGAYVDGEINFGKAAELLGIHPVKLKELFLARGIPVKIGAESKEGMIAEGASAKRIRQGSQ